jgi:hypothetical protein
MVGLDPTFGSKKEFLNSATLSFQKIENISAVREAGIPLCAQATEHRAPAR